MKLDPFLSLREGYALSMHENLVEKRSYGNEKDKIQKD
jgi:hypothetical protein